ncbi:MAG: winged helix-turn-helix transcriptional regulator [Candidatus Aenigmatarchaeota archaeon]
MFTKVNKIGWKILELFFEEPTEALHLREVAKRIDVSPRTAKKHLTDLEDEGFIESEEDGVYLRFKASRNQKFKDWKVLYNLRRIRNSGLVDFLNEKFNFPLIVLFGSASEGDDIDKSDLDIFVLTECKKKVDLEVFEDRMDKEIQLITRTEKELEKMKENNPELLNNILNGIVVSGYWEMFK